MFRFAVALTCFLLCTLSCLTQCVPDEAGSPADTRRIESSPVAGSRSRSLPSAASRISVVRLSVPRKARQLYDKAAKMFAIHRFSDALKPLNQAIALHARFPEALTLRGTTQFNLQRMDEAEKDYQAAIQADPTFGPAYVYLADLYNVERRFDDALAIMQQANSQHSGSWSGQYETAWALLGNKQYDRALKIAEAGLRSNPDQKSLLHLARAHALAGLRMFPQAIRELQTYLTSHPPENNAQQARSLLEEIESGAGQ